MSDVATRGLSAEARTAWAELSQHPGVPRLVDFPVLVTADEADVRPGRIVLHATTEDGEELGHCYVFNNEWYPGCRSTVPFSHYAPALFRVLNAMIRRGDAGPLRLQVLKAVAATTPGQRLMTVLLKFIIAPEYTLTGSQIEEVYGCPLSVFYSRFVGVSWDPQRRRSASSSVRGEAIHAGFRRAASEYVATRDDNRARAAYLDGVRATWINRLPNLFLGRPSQPTKDHTLPIAAVDAVIDYCRAMWPAPGRVSLFQERLFYSPTRGMSGRADRIERVGGDGGPSRVVEIKSGGSFGAERDPATGERRPGGLQALSYREILRSFGMDQIETVVEQVGDDGIVPTALERHPIVSRLGLDLSVNDERAIDLIAQARNVGFCVVSGLYSGYDRHLLDGAAGMRRFLTGLGGDYGLYLGQPPCAICPAGHRGVCEPGSIRRDRALYNMFRYAPGHLFAYWAWFHRQLKDEERIDRQWLYRLVSTPAHLLETQDGVTVAGLTLRESRGYEAVFGRDRRIETRIREDDRVLVTPLERRPGQVLSIEGTVTSIGESEIRVRLRDVLDDTSASYRIDHLAAYEMRPWQVEGLTDFFLASMTGATARGRQIRVEELPRLARVILGHTPPPPLRSVPIQLTDDLNASQRQALAAAMALDPGDLLLIQGPPGTGKTSLIADLARAVLARHFFDYDGGEDRRPILILANTHRAANEVVRKIVERHPDLRPFLIRVGSRRADMEPEVAAQVLAERVGAEDALAGADLAAEGPERLVQIIQRGNRFHDEAGIFVGTLGSADAPELRGLTFEMVVVDETGQATEPAMLQALRHLPPPLSGRLVLVGDHQQLPPVVANDLPAPTFPESHRAFGLREGDSLRTSGFERLARLYPHVLVTLREQYRMNAAICRLVSETFYDGALRPGSPAIARQTLAGWFASLGLPEPRGAIGRPPAILFVDTQHDPAARDSGARFQGRDEARDNAQEARIVAALIAELLQGVPRSRQPALLDQIGVISAYRKQNNRILQELARIDPRLTRIRVDTVDRFQGGEREIIVLSLVNSNRGAVIGPLHGDWRRMNVAISRARRKLVIVGDRDTFTRATERPEEEAARERYRRLFQLIDQLARRGEAEIVDSRELAVSAR